WKAEKARLKELLMTTTSDLKEKALSLSALQAALADALIAKAIHLLSDEILKTCNTGHDGSVKAKYIHKLTLDLKERLIFCETQLNAMREERNNYMLEISVETRESVLEGQLETQTTICQETTKELSASTKEIEKLSSMCADLCDQQDRMEQTWVDNARLVQLLASVEEYQDLVTEMQDGKGLVHMPPSSKIDRYQRLSRRYGCCKDKTQSVNTKTEAHQWIPAETLDIMMAFWKQHCPSIPILTIQELL
ncbi:unnamed protein product, partial [Sphagnum compactum]